jgi:ubiquinone biosynthesis protein Coq4
MANLFSLPNLWILSLVKKFGDSPHKTNNTMKLNNFLYSGAKTQNKMLAKLNLELENKADFIKLFNRYQSSNHKLLKVYHPEQLIKYPKYTLAHIYGKHMIQANFYPRKK